MRCVVCITRRLLNGPTKMVPGIPPYRTRGHPNCVVMRRLESLSASAQSRLPTSKRLFQGMGIIVAQQRRDLRRQSWRVRRLKAVCAGCSITRERCSWAWRRSKVSATEYCAAMRRLDSPP
jgi:hypothetical protein